MRKSLLFLGISCCLSAAATDGVTTCGEANGIQVSYPTCYTIATNNDVNNNEIHVMTGTPLIFSCENANEMTFTVQKPAETDSETSTTPDFVGERSYFYYVATSGEYALTVSAKIPQATAIDEADDEETAEEEVVAGTILTGNFTIIVDDVTPAVPTCTIDQINKQAIISTTAGALQVKVNYYWKDPNGTNPLNGIAETDDDDDDTTTTDISNTWKTVNSNSFSFNFSEDQSIYTLTARSTTPTGETSEEFITHIGNAGIVAGVDTINADASANGEAIYFNLNGQRVNADKPGLYIRSQAGSVEKITIK